MIRFVTNNQNTIIHLEDVFDVLGPRTTYTIVTIINLINSLV